MKNAGIKTDSVLWARQYSKRLITTLLVLWAIGAAIGAFYEFIRLKLSPDIASMDAFYIYLAVPLSCGIPSYVVPNIFLNREKIRQNYIPNYDEIILNGNCGMGGEESYSEEDQKYGNDNGRSDQTDRMYSGWNGYGDPANLQTCEIHQGIDPGKELEQDAPARDVPYGRGGGEL